MIHIFASRLLLVISFVIISPLHINNTDPKPSTHVIVVQEASIQSGCTISKNGARVQRCPLGTVIWADEMTYEEARNRGIKDFAVISDDPEVAKQQRDELVTRVYTRYQSAKTEHTNSIVPMACPNASRNIHGSYTFSSNTPGQPTVEYNLQYQLFSTCNIRSVYDQSRSSSTSNENTVFWSRSCTNGTNSSNLQCINRGINLNSSYTSWMQAPDSTYLARYTNNTQVSNHYAYGFWDMD